MECTKQSKDTDRVHKESEMAKQKRGIMDKEKTMRDKTQGKTRNQIVRNKVKVNKKRK